MNSQPIGQLKSQLASQKWLWDYPTRMIHWVIAGCVVLNLFVIEEGDDWHRWLGYIVVVAVVLRFIWGTITKTPARFTAFPLGQKNLKLFFPTYLSKKPQDFAGHNPAASWVYIFIWLSLLSLGITGWMQGLDAYWGEEWLQELHASFSDFLMLLLLFHLTGLLLDSLKFKRHSWLAMITGRKPRSRRSQTPLN